jgi:hypothetical protein
VRGALLVVDAPRKGSRRRRWANVFLVSTTSDQHPGPQQNRFAVGRHRSHRSERSRRDRARLHGAIRERQDGSGSRRNRGRGGTAGALRPRATPPLPMRALILLVRAQLPRRGDGPSSTARSASWPEDSPMATGVTTSSPRLASSPHATAELGPRSQFLRQHQERRRH